MRRTATFAAWALAALLGVCPGAARAGEADPPNHGGAAVGGAVAGLVCAGGTLVYAKLREASAGNGPLLWHSGDGPGWVGVFFLEHAAVGGLTGALGDDTRRGVAIGGVVTCALDLAWIVSAEVLAHSAREDDEDLDDGQPRRRPLGLAEVGPEGVVIGVPPLVVGPRGAWISLLAWRF